MSLKKVFRKVTKSKLGKAFAIVAAGAAIFFTAGAALGAMGAAGATAGSVGSAAIGGWGAAATSFAGKLATNSLLRGIIGGAIKGAGWGALTGGIIAEATGGKFADGAAGGALVGAAGGAVTGGLTAPRGLEAGVRTPVNAAGAPATGMTPAEGLAPMPDTAGPGFTSAATKTTAAPMGAGGGGMQRGLGSVAKGTGKFLSSDGGGAFAGHVVGGIGQGVLAGAAAEDEIAAQRGMELERAQRTEDNYRTGQAGLALAPGRPRNPVQAGRYEYDPATGKIVFRPAALA